MNRMPKQYRTNSNRTERASPLGSDTGRIMMIGRNHGFLTSTTVNSHAPRPGLQVQHIPPSAAGAMHLGWCTACETSRRSDIALIYTRITHPDRYAPRCYYARVIHRVAEKYGANYLARSIFASHSNEIKLCTSWLIYIELNMKFIHETRLYSA